MSVAEMKVKAMSQLVQIDDENILKEVLKYLEETNYRLQKNHTKSADEIFEAAVAQYGPMLKKLAE